MSRVYCIIPKSIHWKISGGLNEGTKPSQNVKRLSTCFRPLGPYNYKVLILKLNQKRKNYQVGEHIY